MSTLRVCGGIEARYRCWLEGTGRYGQQVCTRIEHHGACLQLLRMREVVMAEWPQDRLPTMTVVVDLRELTMMVELTNELDEDR